MNGIVLIVWGLMLMAISAIFGIGVSAVGREASWDETHVAITVSFAWVTGAAGLLIVMWVLAAFAKEAIQERLQKRQEVKHE